MINAFYGDNIFATSEQMLEYEIDNLNRLSESFDIEPLDEGKILGILGEVWKKFKEWLREMWKKIIGVFEKIGGKLSKTKLGKQLEGIKNDFDNKAQAPILHVLDPERVLRDFKNEIMDPANNLKRELDDTINHTDTDDAVHRRLQIISTNYKDKGKKYLEEVTKLAPQYKNETTMYEKSIYYVRKTIDPNMNPTDAVELALKGVKVIDKPSIERVKKDIDEIIKDVEKNAKWYSSSSKDEFKSIICTLKNFTTACAKTVLLPTWWLKSPGSKTATHG